MFSFTPRVANIWYDFKDTPITEVAALLLALEQDYRFPCETKWEARLELANSVINTWGYQKVRFLLYSSLADFFDCAALSKDFTYLSRLMERKLIVEHTEAPIYKVSEYTPYTPKGNDEYRAWLDLIGKKD